MVYWSKVSDPKFSLLMNTVVAAVVPRLSTSTLQSLCNFYTIIFSWIWWKNDIKRLRRNTQDMAIQLDLSIQKKYLNFRWFCSTWLIFSGRVSTYWGKLKALFSFFKQPVIILGHLVPPVQLLLEKYFCFRRWNVFL